MEIKKRYFKWGIIGSVIVFIMFALLMFTTLEASSNDEATYVVAENPAPVEETKVKQSNTTSAAEDIILNFASSSFTTIIVILITGMILMQLVKILGRGGFGSI